MSRVKSLLFLTRRTAKQSSSHHPPPAMTSSLVVTPSGDEVNGGVVPAEVVILRLQQQVREKDLKLTDVRLEALSSAHQLDSVRDAMNSMKVCISTRSIVSQSSLTIPLQRGMLVYSG